MTTRQLGEVAFAVLGLVLITWGLRELVQIWVPAPNSVHEALRDLLPENSPTWLAAMPLMVGAVLLLLRGWLSRLLFPLEGTRRSPGDAVDSLHFTRVAMVITGLAIVAEGMLWAFRLLLEQFFEQRGGGGPYGATQSLPWAVVSVCWGAAIVLLTPRVIRVLPTASGREGAAGDADHG